MILQRLVRQRLCARSAVASITCDRAPTQALPARCFASGALTLFSRGCTLALVCIASMGCPGSKSSPTASLPAASEAAEDQRALESIGTRKWYDSQQNGFKPPSPAVDPDDPLRRIGRVAPPEPLKPAPAPTGGGGAITGVGSQLFSYMVWIILGATLVGLAIFLAATSMRTWRRSKQTTIPKAIEIDPARMVDLPFEAQAEMRDPLAYARMWLERGDYDGAMLFIYGYMLLALDRAGKIVLHRGKTNRMYLFELNDQRLLRELLQPAMLAFEDQFFGRHAITRERCLRIWEKLDDFHRALAPAIEAAAAVEEIGAS